MEIKLIEIAGFPAFLESLRIPFKKEVRSHYRADSYIVGDLYSSSTTASFDYRDIALASTLKRRGDEHAKSIRLITVDVSINAPIWLWNELVTYTVGVTQGCSESTMHCECKGLSGEELERVKDEIPMGHKQKRIIKFSYQTLSRIYHQRKDHRLPTWQVMIKFIENLPYAEELIL